MPGFNQSGPMGQGPMTGRRMGRCTNYGATRIKTDAPSAETQVQNQPEYFRGRGRSFGFGLMQYGRGRGLGCQNRFRSAW